MPGTTAACTHLWGRDRQGVLCRAGKETQPDGDQGETAAIPAGGLIFWQCLPCMLRALMSTAERQRFLNQTSDVMGRALQGDKRPESRGEGPGDPPLLSPLSLSNHEDPEDHREDRSGEDE